MASRDDYIYYARLAEQGERYEDMIKYMKTVSEVSSLPHISIVPTLAIIWWIKPPTLFKNTA